MTVVPPHRDRSNPHRPRRLSDAQVRALDAARGRKLAAVWLVGDLRTPWYALTRGVRPDTLHALWLAGYVRQELSAERVIYEASPKTVEADRVLLTPAGRRALDAFTGEGSR